MDPRPSPPEPTAFRLPFVAAFLGTAAVLFLAFALARPALTPLPPLPVPGQAYVSEYAGGASRHSAAFYLLHSGLLGFGKKIDAADLLLVGTSHPAFGLSARELGQELSASAGAPVRCFNASMTGDDVSFNRNFLDSHAAGKTVILDLFGWNIHPQPEPASSSISLLEACWSVENVWLSFYQDYFFDRFLPRLYLKQTGKLTAPPYFFYRRHFLLAAQSRNWETNDMEWAWARETLLYSLSGEGHPAQSEPCFGNEPNYHVAQRVAVPAESFPQARFFYILLPFPGAELARLPADAVPFLSIAPEGLLYFDAHHLTAGSRSVATERLAEGLRESLKKAPVPTSPR
ncbi:hypothetical protein SAMN05444156_1624 [Verrucomicrobium sp. GAS474]|uniref:hypothetical protein n=1 Tax=Verrucomicrobium sp. GAS474 TaxID=1882831 RepID=UPI00087D5EE8|nr:hypothetical protein [Verrucomicrobium sp. GAS474]SDU04273.1 hypothetical protein SAMN05444156_1624 [Verrucomicrobium sp. GAS474]